MSSDPVIDVDRLNLNYGDFHAVKDLSFQAERGELYALLGTNGAGKTSSLPRWLARRRELLLPAPPSPSAWRTSTVENWVISAKLFQTSSAATLLENNRIGWMS